MSVESAPVPSGPLQPAPIQATAQPPAPPASRLDVGARPPGPLGPLTAKVWRLESETLDADHRFGVQVLLIVQEYLLEIQAQDRTDNSLDLSVEQIVELVGRGDDSTPPPRPGRRADRARQTGGASVGVKVRPDARKPGRWYVRINHRGQRKSVAFKTEAETMRAAVALERELQRLEPGRAFSELGGIEARLGREIPLGFRTEHSYVQQTIAALLRVTGWTVTLEARVPGLGIVDIRAVYQDRITALIEIGNLSVNDAVPTRGQRTAALHRQADLVLHLPYEHPLFEMLCLPVRLKNTQKLGQMVAETLPPNERLAAIAEYNKEAELPLASAARPLREQAR